MLTVQLRELEYNSIVHRKVYPEISLRVEYSLAEYGHEFKHVLISMKSSDFWHLQDLVCYLCLILKFLIFIK